MMKDMLEVGSPADNFPACISTQLYLIVDRHHPDGTRAGGYQLFQFLPLILLFAMSLFSYPNGNEPMFR